MGKRHSPEQIVRKLRQAEAKLDAGASVPEVVGELGISEATFPRWKVRYGEMSSGEAKRLKELEKENARLKKLVAEQALDIDILQQLAVQLNRNTIWHTSAGAGNLLGKKPPATVRVGQ
jgi:putative transposase